MPTVDFIFDRGCPNVKAARANLIRAFARVGMPARWRSYEVGDVNAPARVRGYGSPTILINGRDVAGARPSSAQSCRIFDGAGIPSVELIAAALLRATHPHDVGA